MAGTAPRSVPKISRKGKISLPHVTFPLLGGESSLIMPAVSLGKIYASLQLHRKSVLIVFFRNSHGSSKSVLLLGGALGDTGSEKLSFLQGELIFACFLIYLPTSFYL